jgi:hypothetical protein
MVMRQCRGIPVPCIRGDDVSATLSQNSQEVARLPQLNQDFSQIVPVMVAFWANSQ